MNFECIEAIKRIQLIHKLKVIPLSLHPRYRRKEKAIEERTKAKRKTRLASREVTWKCNNCGDIRKDLCLGTMADGIHLEVPCRACGSYDIDLIKFGEKKEE